MIFMSLKDLAMSYRKSSKFVRMRETEGVKEELGLKCINSNRFIFDML